MKNWLTYLSLLSIAISYISSLRAFRLDMIKPFKAFSFFLLFVLVGEVFAFSWKEKLYSYTSYTKNNLWFYNLFHLLIYPFYIWLFLQLVYLKNVRSIIKILWVAFYIFAAYNLIKGQGLYKLNSHTILFTGVIMIFLSISYYYQLLYAKNIITLKRDTGFWISTGLLINQLGSVLALFFISILGILSKDTTSNILLFVKISVLVMYITYSIAFLCHKTK